jgi:hypothetical protein
MSWGWSNPQSQQHAAVAGADAECTRCCGSNQACHNIMHGTCLREATPPAVQTPQPPASARKPLALDLPQHHVSAAQHWALLVTRKPAATQQLAPPCFTAPSAPNGTMRHAHTHTFAESSCPFFACMSLPPNSAAYSYLPVVGACGAAQHQALVMVKRTPHKRDVAFITPTSAQCCAAPACFDPPPQSLPAPCRHGPRPVCAALNCLPVVRACGSDTAPGTGCGGEAHGHSWPEGFAHLYQRPVLCCTTLALDPWHLRLALFCLVTKSLALQLPACCHCRVLGLC